MNCWQKRMVLRKWRTSHPNTIPPELHEVSGLNISPAPSAHGITLGYHQSRQSVRVHSGSSYNRACHEATCFFCCGQNLRCNGMFFSSYLCLQNYCLQKAWSLHLSWDDPLPPTLHLHWEEWLQDIPLLGKHSVPHNVCPPSDYIQLKSLHGYCDASAKAYGAVVYLRVVHKDTTITTHLLAAKSKLAPLKVQTIPRLELCGAQLLSKLLIQVISDLNLPNDSVFAWTDSAVVLGWLKTSAHRLKVFVAHRITDTLSKVPSN